MKGVKVALRSMECLFANAIKILGEYFSSTKKIEYENNFLDHITKL